MNKNAHKTTDSNSIFLGHKYYVAPKMWKIVRNQFLFLRTLVVWCAQNMKKSAESIHKVRTVNICYLVHFGGRYCTNVKSPDMGLEKRTRGALRANWGAYYSDESSNLINSIMLLLYDCFVSESLQISLISSLSSSSLIFANFSFLTLFTIINF